MSWRAALALRIHLRFAALEGSKIHVYCGVLVSANDSLTRLLRQAVWPRDRRPWALLAFGLIFFAYTFRYVSAQVRDAHAFSDGFYTWIYARSLAYDFDINLTNDYALCGDPFKLGIDEGGGRPANPFYFGPALFLAPILWIVKTLVHFRPATTAQWVGGCSGPIVAYTGYAAVLAALITLWLSYRAARRFYDEIPCCIALLVVGLASPLSVFGPLSWYYSHVWSALSVAIAFTSFLEAHDAPRARSAWLLCGLGGGLAALMRIQEGIWLLVPCASILWHALRARRAGDARWAGAAVARSLCVAGGFLTVFSIQLYVYWRVYGWPFVVPQGKVYVQFAHAHPWLLLFGARSGLFYWTPLMWLAVLGIPWLIWDRRLGPLGLAIVLAAVGNVYVSSSALSWTGGATLGARVQTSLAVAFVLGIAASSGAIHRWARRRRAAAGTAVVLLLAPWLWLTWVSGTAGLSNDRVVRAPELYGAAATHGIADVYSAVGNPWTLPGTLVFAARYGAHPRVFDRVAEDGMWRRDFRTLKAITTDTFSFLEPPPGYWSEGIVDVGEGVGLPAAGHGRFLISLYWPWVTAVRVTAHPMKDPAVLSIESASFWRSRELGRLRFDGKQTVEITVPRDAFDSGINEVILSSDQPIVLDAWQWLDTSTHDTSVRLFQ